MVTVDLDSQHLPPELCRTARDAPLPSLVSMTALLRSFLVEEKVFTEPWGFEIELYKRKTRMSAQSDRGGLVCVCTSWLLAPHGLRYQGLPRAFWCLIEF